MNFERFIGIDPGVHGALAFVTRDGKAVVHKVDDTQPRDAVLDAIAGVDFDRCIATVELVGGFVPGRPQPASRAGVLMRSLGKWEGLLEGFGIRYQLVRPQAWQAGIPGRSKVYADNKKALHAEAIRRFPCLRFTKDGADALLIADFCQRVHTGALASLAGNLTEIAS